MSQLFWKMWSRSLDFHTTPISFSSFRRSHFYQSSHYNITRDSIRCQRKAHKPSERQVFQSGRLRLFCINMFPACKSHISWQMVCEMENCCREEEKETRGDLRSLILRCLICRSVSNKQSYVSYAFFLLCCLNTQGSRLLKYYDTVEA